MSECHDCGAAPGTNLDCPTCSRWAAGLGAASEGLTARFAREFGVNEATAIEMLAWVDAECGNRGGAADALRELNARVFAAVSVLCEYQAQQARPEELRMSTRCLAMALGFSKVAGGSNAAELGRHIGMEKATVNKCLNQFLKRLGMERLPGQRDGEARKNMALARKSQLKKGNEHDQ